MPQAPLFLALVESEKEVIDEAQPVINKRGLDLGHDPRRFREEIR